MEDELPLHVMTCGLLIFAEEMLVHFLAILLRYIYMYIVVGLTLHGCRRFLLWGSAGENTIIVAKKNSSKNKI